MERPSLLRLRVVALWPQKASRDKIPVAASAHGTSGLSANDGPSHLSGLSYQYVAPYILALAGCVVVGLVNAGLGVSTDARGSAVTSQF